MNSERYNDPTADIAIGHIARKEKEMERMELQQVERELKRYNYIQATLRELKEQLASVVPKITSTIDAAPAMTNSFHSKVEDLGNRRIELNEKIAKKEQELKRIRYMIANSGLTEEEKGVIWYVAQEKRLQFYAREHGIKQSNVYKIRDRALKKIANHNMKQIRVKT